jgi:CSLREA domain-containing protein
MALLPGSPAIDAGNNTGGPDTDQRGFVRTADVPGALNASDGTDIGAFEGRLFVVNSIEDTDDGDPTNSTTTLREAVNAANQAADADVILFAPGLAGQVITLTAGQLEIAHDLIIDGRDAPNLLISGNHASRVFQVDRGTTASLSGLTIIGGQADYGGGIDNWGTVTINGSTLSDNSASFDGGGIRNRGTVTISSSSKLSGNSATYGGGIANWGEVTISGTTLSSNSASGSGGGIVNWGTVTISSSSTLSNNSASYGGGIDNWGTVTVSDSTLSSNAASSEGGGISNHGTVTVSGSTLSGNSAGEGGGGIANWGTVTINGSTLSSNSASGYGGGIAIFGSGTLTISDSTLSDNSASTDGGGIYDWGTLTVGGSTLSDNSASGNGGGIAIANDGHATLHNTLVARNTLSGRVTPSDIDGSVDVTSSYNLIGDGSGGLDAARHNLLGSMSSPLDPKLDPKGLQNNGGPTQTIALLPGSPAIDAGSNALAVDANGNPLTTDQRGVGFARIVNGTVDIGAYEQNVSPVANAGGPYTLQEGESLTLNASASSDPDGDPLTYSWDINGDGIFGDATGVSPTLTWAQLEALGINDGPHTFKVQVRVDDGYGGTHSVVSTATTLEVNNVAPTASLSNNGPVNEASAVTVSFSGQSDPSTADTAADFHYSFALSQADLATSYAGATDGASKQFAFSDNGTYTVYGRIFDKDGGFTDYQTQVTVSNVAPTATLGNNGPVAEGSSVTASFTNPFDPSSTDTAAGFHYSFALSRADLATSYAGATDGASKQFAFSDNGTYTVYGRIFDKDGGFTDYQTQVTVNPVAPRVTLSGPASANEGQTQHYTFTTSDPGQDTFSVVATSGGSVGTVSNLAFDSATGAGSFDVTFSDGPATSAVSVQVKDSDDALSNVSSIGVAVANVAPGLTAPADQSSSAGASTSFSLGSFTDPGADNPWTVRVDWGDGSPVETFTVSSPGALARDHAYAASGPYTVTVQIRDKDGASDSQTFRVAVAQVPLPAPRPPEPPPPIPIPPTPVPVPPLPPPPPASPAPLPSAAANSGGGDSSASGGGASPSAESPGQNLGEQMGLPVLQSILVLPTSLGRFHTPDGPGDPSRGSAVALRLGSSLLEADDSVALVEAITRGHPSAGSAPPVQPVSTEAGPGTKDSMPVAREAQPAPIPGVKEDLSAATGDTPGGVRWRVVVAAVGAFVCSVAAPAWWWWHWRRNRLVHSGRGAMAPGLPGSSEKILQQSGVGRPEDGAARAG